MADVIDKILEFRRQERPFLAVGVIAAAVCSAVWLPAWISAAWLAANLISASAGQWVIERRFAHARRGWSEWELAAWTMISAIFYALLPLLLVIQRDQMATLTAVCIAGSLLLRGANEFSISKLTGGAILSSMFIIATFGAIFHMFDAPILQIGAVLVTLSAFFAYILDHAQHRRDGERRLADALAAAERNERRANAASEAKSTFLATMSHEIRTPLNGIVGIAAAMARTDLDPRQQEMVGLINMSGETLERLLSDLLDLSKIEAGHIDLNLEPFDLKTSVEAAAKVMKAAAEDKGLDFTVSFAPSAEGVFVGDAVRIRQIVTNLISNAVKFTTSGSVALQVNGEAAPDASAPTLVHIRVSDTGIGFDSETADKLFRRFEQADGSITRRFGGTGLGLSISQALAIAMGGRIVASGEPGVGSQFQLTLPLRREGKGHTDPATPAPHHPGPMTDTALKILLAEDHPVNRRTIQLILEPFGFEILEATDGVEAVDLYQHQDFDLILMDMQMPNMDGLEATRAIRAIETRTGRARTPIVMVSANAMPAHAEQALAAGCDVHVPKPITPTSLMDGLNRAFECTEPA